ncbi:uncharacterized protein LOC128724649 [Anopheles nili]|uniref:uncharacterized protein LOC128724649 n=1 Tax=Anopheles nili TaxID=185578 RepID=UPI00237A5055|nr:uncharacterized protein LOC128724649 [Anopheles nili]
MHPQSRAHRKPPDVEEALSSMLWTPYDNGISESDSSDEAEALHRVNNNFFGTGSNHGHRRQQQQQQQSLMRRSLSAWSYRVGNRSGKPGDPTEADGAGNRFSYPYYDLPELGIGALGGGFAGGGWYGYSSTSSTSSNINNNHCGGNTINGSSYGCGVVPVTGSRSSYSFPVETHRLDERAPWQTLTAAEDRTVEKRPYLHQLQTPFVGRWHSGVSASQLETSSLPFSLLALDGPASVAVGPLGGDGVADSCRDDYQLAISERVTFDGSSEGMPHAGSVMRLNVPAAGLADGASRTSVYIPAEGGGAGGGAGPPRPALSIQVNRLDPDNQQQNDVVSNALSGVSIVSCYRAGESGAGVMAASGVAGARPQCSVEACVSREQAPEVDPVEPAGESEGVNTSTGVGSGGVPEPVVQVSSGAAGEEGLGARGGEELSPGSASGGGSPRTYTSTEAQTDDTATMLPSSVQPAVLLGHRNGPGFVPGPAYLGGGAPSEPIVATLLGAGSEFSTREHRRRERRERRQARHRLQHIHPLEPPVPAGPNLLHRSPPPIEIIPDILHSHLPPPYTTLPMGATLMPQLIPANAAAAAVSALPVRAAEDCRYTFPIPIMRSSPSERSRKGCCGHWFAGPPLRALIAVVALGGVACALGGAALGATGLAGSPTSHLTAALLMIGVGVILVTVSGAAWRMTAPGAPPCLGLGSTVDLGRCSRRPCGRGGSTPHGLLYPEFQHRPPPPSYQASMQEYRLRLLLLDRDRQSGRMRSTASPPPTYRSNVGSLLRIPLSSRYNNGSSNSIFGGISGIISGAVGGGSSSSVNNVPPGGDPAVSSSPNPTYGSEGHSTLPPSYRSVHLQPALPPQPVAEAPQRPSQPRTVEDADLISEDNTHSTGANHHAPSIIKIDDRRNVSTASVAVEQSRQRNSIPNVSLIDTGSEEPSTSSEPSASNVNSNVSNNSRPCTAGIVPIATSHSPAASSGSKDLVTIVTISGAIESSAAGSGRTVYTTSNGNTQPGGATCTLLNSNSTPLLATVIPVSKSATAATTTPSVTTGPL